MYIERDPDRNTFFIFYKLLGFSTNRVKIGANVKVLKKNEEIKDFADFLTTRRKKFMRKRRTAK